MYNDIKRQSREQGVITKKYVATDTILKFKMTLYSNALILKVFNSCRRLKLLATMKLKASLLLTLSRP